jgi:tetratricopeptide (TPR) repeat protein
MASLFTSNCSRNSQTYLEDGNRFFDQGKYDAAEIQYRNALQKSPDLGEAHYRLGLTQIKKNRIPEAYQQLRQASQLLPDDGRVLAKLGELAIALYDANPRHPRQLYDQAVEATSKLTEKDPDGFDTTRLRGALALIDKKPRDAVRYLRKAVAAKPDDQRTTLDLARGLVQESQVQAGIDLMRGLIQKDKTFGPAYDSLFEQYHAAHKEQDAEDILKLKVANNPKQGDFLLELARYYAATSKAAEMNATLQRMLDHSPDFPNSRMRVGDFYSSLGRLDEAARLYQEGLAAKPKDPSSYRKRLVRLLAAQRKFPEALQQVDAILKAVPGDQESKLAQAGIWIEEGKPENLDPAIVELGRQLRDKPEDPFAHFELGLGLARKGDQDGARREWLKAASQNPNYPQPRLALLEMDLQQGKLEEALKMSEEILAAAPNNLQARLVHANCLARVGRYGEARTELDHLVSQNPQSIPARFQLGVLAISERRYEDAEGIFRQLANTETGDPRGVVGLAETYQAENQSQLAVKLLQDELKRSPGSTPVRGLLAQVAMATGNRDLAIEQYKQMVAAAPKSMDIQIALAEAYSAKGDFSAAVDVLQKASQAAPKSATVTLLLAQALSHAGQISDAKASYRHVLEMQPDNLPALNNLAFLMAETGENLDEALSLAQRGLGSAIEPKIKTSLQDTVGWLYLKKNMYDSALQSFQGLVKRNPDNPTYHYHLGATLFAKGEQRKARAELEAALAAKPMPADEPKIRALLARI